MRLVFKPTPQGAQAIRDMSGISASVKKQAAKALASFGAQAKKGTQQAVLANDKVGRLYRRLGMLKRAGAAGQAPQYWSKRYLRGLRTKSSGRSLVYGNTAPYAGYLERGTRKMAARPGMGNTWRQLMPTFGRRFWRGYKGHSSF